MTRIHNGRILGAFFIILAIVSNGAGMTITNKHGKQWNHSATKFDNLEF